MDTLDSRDRVIDPVEQLASIFMSFYSSFLNCTIKILIKIEKRREGEVKGKKAKWKIK